MKNKLLTYALISSPLLGLFGACPFLIFGILDLTHSTIVFLGVSISVLLYWAANYIIIYRLKISNRFFAIGLSFFFAFFSKLIFLIIGAPLLAFKATIAPFMIYPAVVTIALNTFVLFIVYFLKREDEIKKADRLISDLKVENLDAQKQSLLRQLKPHFLFNSLSILKSLVHENPQKAEDYILKLSDFFRYSVDSNGTENVLIKDEIDFVTNYIDLQRMRFENSFEIDIQIPQEVMSRKLPYMALQTVIENVFKHNRFTEKNPVKINAHFDGQNIIITNNIQSLKHNNRKGSGLENLEKRYKLMGVSTFTYSKTENQFKVQLPVMTT